MSAYRAPGARAPRPQPIYSYAKRVQRTRGKAWFYALPCCLVGVLAGSHLFFTWSEPLTFAIVGVCTLALVVPRLLFARAFRDGSGAPSADDMETVDAPKDDAP